VGSYFQGLPARNELRYYIVIAKFILRSNMLKQFIEKYDRQIQRGLEILPGVITWTFITSPVWAGLFFPEAMAYVVIFFALYWFCQSARIARGIFVSYRQMKKDTNRDWLSDCQKHPDFEKIQHLVIIPTYKEPLHTLERTLEGFKRQTFPKKRMHLVLAQEEREGEAGRQKMEALVKKFGSTFAHLWVTYHPDIPGEVKGKSSNMAWAGKWAKKKLVDELGYALEFIILSANDADSIFHPRHLSCVTHKFLSLPQTERHLKFFQAAIVFYNNLWRVPFPVRIRSATSSVIEVGRLATPQDMHPFSAYSVSLRAVHNAGYWAVNVVPEDYDLFYRCFFAHQGKMDVEPIFLFARQDAAESTTFWGTIKNHYQQVRRWAYGVSADPYVVKQSLTHSEIPLPARLYRLLLLGDCHFLWAAKSFIPFGSFVALLVNPTFSQTVLAHNLPQIASTLFKSCFLFTIALIAVDVVIRPAHPKNYSKKKLFLISVFDWFLSPTVGLLFSVLPAIDAHTRLMLGKYLEYKVTEKV